jgi:hypothetical protein
MCLLFIVFWSTMTLTAMFIEGKGKESEGILFYLNSHGSQEFKVPFQRTSGGLHFHYSMAVAL